ncbi:MAG: zinc ribbon domain-containing protein [Ruminococcaceae bacterium]|nr:zinc ribbon domain-containing protein [Oscillospiraceae bacterium]
MSDFLDKVLTGINKGVSSVKGTSETLMKKARINADIKESEDEKLKLYQSLGIKIYNMYMSKETDFADEINEYCEAVTKKIAQIKALHKKLDEINGDNQSKFITPDETYTECECGYKNSPDAKFCAKCGIKLKEE